MVYFFLFDMTGYIRIISVGKFSDDIKIVITFCLYSRWFQIYEAGGAFFYYASRHFYSVMLQSNTNCFYTIQGSVFYWYKILLSFLQPKLIISFNMLVLNIFSGINTVLLGFKFLIYLFSYRLIVLNYCNWFLPIYLCVDDTPREKVDQ